MSHRYNSLRAFALVTVLVLGVAACDGDDSNGAGGIEILDGVIAETVPSDFPIPNEAVPGSSLINRNNDPTFTEVTLRIPAPLSAVQQYYVTNLPLQNYTITNTASDNFGVSIDFTRDELVGELTLQEEVSIQVTTVVLKFNPPS